MSTIDKSVQRNTAEALTIAAGFALTGIAAHLLSSTEDVIISDLNEDGKQDVVLLRAGDTDYSNLDIRINVGGDFVSVNEYLDLKKQVDCYLLVPEVNEPCGNNYDGQLRLHRSEILRDARKLVTDR
ncbi:hypothetical protein ACFL1B_01230 [Nanoarchaeota archaeon]